MGEHINRPDSHCRVLDDVATLLRFPSDAPSRGAAAMVYELRAASGREAHTHLPWAMLRTQTLQMLKGSSRTWRRDAEGRPAWPDDGELKDAVRVRLEWYMVV